MSRFLTIATILAMGVGGAAAQGFGSGDSNSNSPPPGQIEPSGAGAVANGGSAQFFAVVHANATIARDKGAVSATKILTGSYEVKFARNIKQCVYTATIGNPGAGNPVSGFIVVALRSGTTDSVFVETRDAGAALADRPFHLWINC